MLWYLICALCHRRFTPSPFVWMHVNGFVCAVGFLHNFSASTQCFLFVTCEDFYSCVAPSYAAKPVRKISFYIGTFVVRAFLLPTTLSVGASCRLSSPESFQILRFAPFVCSFCSFIVELRLDDDIEWLPCSSFVFHASCNLRLLTDFELCSRRHSSRPCNPVEEYPGVRDPGYVCQMSCPWTWRKIWSEGYEDPLIDNLQHLH
jgi:hypothetical protein